MTGCNQLAALGFPGPRIWLPGCDVTALKISPMAPPAQNPDTEYWRPANPALAQVVRREALPCPSCAAECSPAARFCQTCGSELKPSAAASQESGPPQLLNSKTPGRHAEFSLPCLFFFILGIACLTAVLAISLLYRPGSVAEWQAVQAWRIQWLLGACASFLAGMLLLRAKPGN